MESLIKKRPEWCIKKDQGNNYKWTVKCDDDNEYFTCQYNENSNKLIIKGYVDGQIGFASFSTVNYDGLEKEVFYNCDYDYYKNYFGNQ